jgi:uncharacterized protein YqjF (DUF2071 family)
MHPAFARTDHRPWPLPDRPWVWRQRWCDLLFAHWPIAAAALRPLVPEPLEIDTFDGQSWVGVVPFRMAGVMMRPLPDLPGISAFPEMNLRLYVTISGKPGVWFVSLDAANLLAVMTARRVFHLPYYHAAIQVRGVGDRIEYSSERRRAATPVRFRAAYWPTGSARESRPGSLDYFLSERYCLYTQSPVGSILRANVHHPPWQLHPAAADIQVNEVAAPQGVHLDNVPPVLHFSRAIDAVVWPFETVTCT